jgi:putative ABC transport system permease protein
MAYHSLQEQKLRSALSMLGVIFGIISVVTMLSVGEGAKRKTLEQIEQLGIQNIILKTMKLTEAQQLHASERLSCFADPGKLSFC